WLAWNAGSVVQVARRNDEEGDYAALPILADALEDAGCDDADILTHCRAGQPHPDSCWVIDLLLGRTAPDIEGEHPAGKRVRAILSSVHGTLEALKAVFADMEHQQVGEFYCLGDTMGYGPNPVECLQLIQKHCAVVLLGNHDQATLFYPDGFGEVAYQA